MRRPVKRPDLAEYNRRPRPDVVERNRQGHKGGFLYEEAGWLREAYEGRKLSIRQIAAEAECGVRTIARWMRIHGIATRSMSEGCQLNRRRGEDNPGWIGGPPKCRCGKRIYRRDGPCMDCRDRTGALNPKWRGDAIEYPAAHERVKAQRGFAAQFPCFHCQRPAGEWAYDHLDPDEKSGVDGPFSLDVRHYMPLCVRCHRRFDNGRAKRRRQSP